MPFPRGRDYNLVGRFQSLDYLRTRPLLERTPSSDARER